MKDRYLDIVTPANKGLGRFKPGPGHEDGFIIKRGMITRGGDDCLSVWDYGLIRNGGTSPQTAIYFICPRCGKISVDVYVSSGHPTNCLVCDKCDRHLWMTYEGLTTESWMEFLSESSKKKQKRRSR